MPSAGGPPGHQGGFSVGNPQSSMGEIERMIRTVPLVGDRIADRFYGGEQSDSTASAKAAAEQAAAEERAEAAANREFSAREVEKAREWQEFYERNKYRWNMEGMREAGLNPILAYQLMSGGSASSAVAQPTKANIASAYSAEYNRIVGESANTVRSTASMLSLIAVLGAVMLRASLGTVLLRP